MGQENGMYSCSTISPDEECLAKYVLLLKHSMHCQKTPVQREGEQGRRVQGRLKKLTNFVEAAILMNRMKFRGSLKEQAARKLQRVWREYYVRGS